MLENRIYEIPKFEMDYPDFESVEGGDFMEKLQDAFDRYGRDEVIVITPVEQAGESLQRRDSPLYSQCRRGESRAATC